MDLPIKNGDFHSYVKLPEGIWGYHGISYHEIWSVHQRTHCVDVGSCWGTTGKTATVTTPSQHPVDSHALYISWLIVIPINVHNSHFPPAWIHIVTPNIPSWTAAIFMRFSRCYRGRRNLAICSLIWQKMACAGGFPRNTARNPCSLAQPQLVQCHRASEATDDKPVSVATSL